MEDNKDFDIGMEDGGEEENKKLVDKFLTIKVCPDEDKKKRHFEKMLEAFRSAKVHDSPNIRELSDEEIDFVAAAGAGRPEYGRCPICGKMYKGCLLDDHIRSVHGKA